jgi:hypothetical protein
MIMRTLSAIAVVGAVIASPAMAANATSLPVSDPNITVIENRSFYVRNNKEIDVFWDVTYDWTPQTGICVIKFQLPKPPMPWYDFPPGTQVDPHSPVDGVIDGRYHVGNEIYVISCSGDWGFPQTVESPGRSTKKIHVRYLSQ